MQVLNDVDTRQEQAYYDGASSIIINAYDDEDPDGQAVNSISFQSYATIGCILAEKSDWWSTETFLQLMKEVVWPPAFT